jgi:hypothetical protein
MDPRLSLREAEPLPAIVRAYTPHRARPRSSSGLEPSPFSLTFDCETTNDTVHSLRFGAYQARWMTFIQEEGIFYDPALTSDHDLGVLEVTTRERGIELIDLDELIDHLLLRYGYDLNGIVLSFNLAFDISRIARGHVPSASKDAFSFDLSETRRKLRLRVRQRNGRSHIEFVTRGSRHPSDHGGHFVELSNLARALTGTHHSLKTLAQTLGTEYQKVDAKHGEALDPAYVGYCLNDVQVTWECFDALRERYDSYKLTQTPITRVASEASIGKAALREIGVKPFRAVQPDFPAHLLGKIMTTYYGGRSEVRLCRELAAVIYCDFLSMYTTCCANLGLWQYVISEGMDYHDATDEARTFLEDVTLDDLRQPSTWRRMAMIVEIAPSKTGYRYGPRGRARSATTTEGFRSPRPGSPTAM